jgi:hypothetical protein
MTMKLMGANNPFRGYLQERKLFSLSLTVINELSKYLKMVFHERGGIE